MEVLIKGIKIDSLNSFLPGYQTGFLLERLKRLSEPFWRGGKPFQRPLEKKSMREVLGAKRPALIKCSYCNLIKEGEINKGLRLKK